MGGPDEIDNLEGLCALHHLAKTAADLTAIARAKRLAGETCTKRGPPIPQRVDPWPKGRKMQSRGFR